jgi:hypothetical protein
MRGADEADDPGIGRADIVVGEYGGCHARFIATTAGGEPCAGRDTRPRP